FRSSAAGTAGAASGGGAVAAGTASGTIDASGSGYAGASAGASPPPATSRVGAGAGGHSDEAGASDVVLGCAAATGSTAGCRHETSATAPRKTTRATIRAVTRRRLGRTAVERDVIGHERYRLSGIG